MTKTPDVIKYFLKAKTPEALQMLMLQKNIDTNTYYEYLIIHDGKIWYAWYESDADALLKDRVNELGKNNTR